MQEDGKQNSVNLFVGTATVAAIGYFLYCRATGRPLWDNTPTELMGSSIPLSILQIITFMLTAIGGVVVGGFNTVIPIVKGFFSFLFPGAFTSTQRLETTHRVQIGVNGPTAPTQFAPQPFVPPAPISSFSPPVTSFVQTTPSDAPVILTVGADGIPRRDLALEKQIAGPQTPDEILYAFTQAGAVGDWEKAGEYFDMLHPEQA